MFESLGDRLNGVFKELRGEGHLTDYHLETAFRQIRLALLEADVALPVVRDFTARVKEKAIGAKVTQQLSPAQEVTRLDCMNEFEHMSDRAKRLEEAILAGARE